MTTLLDGREWWTTTIVRDFAYPESDPRSSGIQCSPQEEDEDEEEEEPVHEDSDDSDDDEAVWQWSSTRTKNPLPLLKARDFDSVVLALLAELIRPQLQNTQTTFRLYRVKALFPFVKASDYEMSLDSGDEVIVVELKKIMEMQEPLSESNESAPVDSAPIDSVNTTPKGSHSSPSHTTSISNSVKEPKGSIKDPVKELSKEAKEPKERWMSIDDIDDTDPTKVSIESTRKASIVPSSPTIPESSELELDPPLDRFTQEISQFLGFNASYGLSWLTGIKIKVRGCDTPKHIKIKMLDLGLVPGNYIEPQ